MCFVTQTSNNRVRRVNSVVASCHSAKLCALAAPALASQQYFNSRARYRCWTRECAHNISNLTINKNVIKFRSAHIRLFWPFWAFPDHFEHFEQVFECFWGNTQRNIAGFSFQIEISLFIGFEECHAEDCFDLLFHIIERTCRWWSEKSDKARTPSSVSFKYHLFRWVQNTASKLLKVLKNVWSGPARPLHAQLN